MKKIRRDFPAIWQYDKKGHTYWKVDLRRKHYTGPTFKSFNRIESAKSYATEVAEKVSKEGVKSISIVGVDPRIAKIEGQLAQFGKTLDEAIQVALGVFRREQVVKESPFFGELLTVWIDDKRTGLKKLRPKSLKNLSSMADIFKADFGMVKIQEIDEKRVVDYLKGKDLADQSRENYRNVLSQFFNWCKKNKYHTENPAEKIEIEVSKGTTKFFTVEQCKEIMRLALDPQYKDVTAYLALCLFGGIRPEEVCRMTWEKNILMDTKEIFLNHEITKTKKDRQFRMNDNLFEWLQFCKKLDTKLLAPAESNIHNYRNKLTKLLSFPWIQDGLRHSFATFSYAKSRNYEDLRHVMGNSPGIIERFYKGIISHTEVEKFFAITPESLEKK